MRTKVLGSSAPGHNLYIYVCLPIEKKKNIEKSRVADVVELFYVEGFIVDSARFLISIEEKQWKMLVKGDSYRATD